MLQVVATIVTNWGQQWFTHFPQPPLPVLGELGELMAFHDPELFQALSSGENSMCLMYSRSNLPWLRLQQQKQHALLKAATAEPE